MFKSFAMALSRFALLLLCTLPLTSQGASSKEAPLDLSILEQRDALRPYMTARQRIAYVEAAKLIKQGQSDIRSGQTLQQQRPSALDPNKDLKPIHKRGERLAEEGQAKIRQGQQQLVKLLSAVQEAKIANQAIAAQKFNFDLVEQDDYATALKVAAKQTLEACQTAGYQNVFFDGLRIVTAEQNAKAGPKLHNAAYDTFIQADGSQFRVAVPLGLQLANSDTSQEYTFQYDNAAAFKGEKAALLAIELIAPSNDQEALLSVRTFDLASQQLISSVMFYIKNASDALQPDSEPTETTEPTETEVATTEAVRSIPASITINNSNQLIEKLAGLPSPYLFETVTTTENPAQAALIDVLIKDTVLKNSELILVESLFIQRAYLPDGVEAEALSSAATAELSITPNEDDYTIVAIAYESGRELEIGTIALQLPE
ncbi:MULTISPECIES: hypothetical protein [unclassified Lentimonas]|uniref:hypothetical protein n=1 Tax=unclassified Lentimonas TaxID=2630993 RepID=UPI0013243872|nr:MULTISPECIES: hypothetical protein [unclassified Lentimonas]CAA6677110.1 Unannotated [Lentimonas sp. CC4]CAA6686268.1 Unannotated [Lentimonas sp. CC6]CAA7074296.1 Unannotated [Lentimonas sp. CC4]CAA7171127.1 Unannotated [Lentimonas sp. CC21]CAA7180111.1 Unannotated [Lentimonas sp. CC8]